MTPRIVLTVIGTLVVIHGLAFLFGAADIAQKGINDLDEKQLMVGTANCEIVAMFNLFLGIVLVFARNLELSAAKTVLKGTGVGLIVLLGGIIMHMITLQEIPEAQPPLPVLIIFSLLTPWTFYVALAKKES